MAKRIHPLDRNWFMRDHGGIPGWGILLAIAMMAGLAAWWALQAGTATDSSPWSPPVQAETGASASPTPLSVTGGD